MYGELENDLLLRFGLCLDPSSEAAAGVAVRALRAIKPEHGLSQRDIDARAELRKRTRSELFPIAPGSKGILPGFDRHPDDNRPAPLAVQVSKVSLERLGEKIVRGLTYLLERRLIGAEYAIEVHQLRSPEPDPITSMMHQHGQTMHRGPGIIVTRAAAQDDRVCALFRIQIWDRLVLHAVVHAKVDASN